MQHVFDGIGKIGRHFFSSHQEAPASTKGNIINFVNRASIVAFTELSLNRKAASAIIKAHKLGLNDPSLEEKLCQGDYQEVLSAIWSEQDRTKCFKWLEAKLETLDPLLMFEYGVAAFQQNKTVETLREVSIPIFAAARFRVMQDSQCCQDPSVYNGDQGSRMMQTYVKRVTAIAERNGINFNDALEGVQEKRNAKIKEVAAKSQEVALNSPVWISSHGLRAMAGVTSMHPQDTWKEKRDTFAQESIEKLS